MSEVKWIKILVSMFDDEKIDYIAGLPEADAIIVIWIRLLTMAGKSNAGGFVLLTEKIPYTDEMLAEKFKKPLTLVKMALAVFVSLDMIEMLDNKIFVTNFEKHQNIEALEKIKEQTRLRVAKHRSKLALSEGNVTVTLPVTQCNATDIDIDIDKECNIYIAVFDFWNNKKIVQHKKLSDKTRRKIKALSSTYSLDDFKKAISNYEVILHDPKYYWTHVWTLDDFLQRGFEKFLIDECFNNYSQRNALNSCNKSPANKGNFEQRKYTDEDFEKLYTI